MFDESTPQTNRMLLGRSPTVVVTPGLGATAAYRHYIVLARMTDRVTKGKSKVSASRSSFRFCRIASARWSLDSSDLVNNSNLVAVVTDRYLARAIFANSTPRALSHILLGEMLRRSSQPMLSKGSGPIRRPNRMRMAVDKANFGCQLVL